MSLRPNFYGFSLHGLTSRFGCKDESLVREVTALWDRKARLAEDRKQRGRELIEDILRHGHERVHPPVEDSLWQIVVDCVARFGHQLERSDSIFWESFLVEIASGRVRGDEETQPLLDFLVRGRPFFGDVTESDWSYYAYLTNHEAVRLFRFIRGDESLRQEFDFASALDWMNRIESTGRDVWYWAS
jgi:hypothetical protein